MEPSLPSPRHLSLARHFSVHDSWAWKSVLKVRDDLVNTSSSIQTATSLISSWTTDDGFATHHAYDFMRTKRRKVSWHKVIWDASIVPKHTIISTLAAKNSLPIVDNIQTIGYQLANMCVLCHNDEENAAHLFFSCSLSRAILYSIKHWVNFDNSTNNYQQILWLLRRQYSSNNWHSSFHKCALIASV